MLQLQLLHFFIRAPRIRRLGEGVEALAECRGEVVMARQGPNFRTAKALCGWVPGPV